MTLRESLDKVLKANAADVVQNQGLHSWRCEYPDRYGPCKCYEIMLDELVLAVTTWESDTDYGIGAAVWPGVEENK